MQRMFVALVLVAAVGCGEIEYENTRGPLPSEVPNDDRPGASPRGNPGQEARPEPGPGRNTHPTEPGVEPALEGFECASNRELRSLVGTWADEGGGRLSISQDLVMEGTFQLCLGEQDTIEFWDLRADNSAHVATTWYTRPDLLAFSSFQRISERHTAPIGEWVQYTEARSNNDSEGQLRLLVLQRDGTAHYQFEEWAGDGGGGGGGGDYYWHVEEGPEFDVVVISGDTDERYSFDGVAMWDSELRRAD